jgi:glycoprotein 3-alpha-L-fucosyltransferase
MLRSKNIRLKLVITLITLCLLLTYLIKNNTSSGYENELNKYDINLEEFTYESKMFFHLNRSQLNLKLMKHDLNIDKEIERDLEYIREQKRKSAQTISIFSNQSFKITQKNKRRLLTNKKKKYLILEYTKVFYQPKFCSKPNVEIFNSQMEECEYSNCVYSCNKESDLKNADALIFHLRDMETEFKSIGNMQTWLAGTSQIPFKTVEKKLENNPNQLWILWNDEASFINPQFDQISNLFNWTLSYKTDAEIYEGSYGFFDYTNHITPESLIRFKKQIFYNNFEKRINAILWFVSNCNSKQRIQVALDISKYFPLHIYGSCDPLDGLNESERKQKYPHLKVTKFANTKTCAPGSLCEEKKLNSYKYYLAFENRNCSDYITEKLWRSLKKNLIPIVFQPNEDSFIRYSIPTKSFLHLNNFKNDPFLLSEYLWNMNTNFDLYYEHIKWTFVYMKTIFDMGLTEPHRMCQLCKKLNTFTSKVSYAKIAGFFNDNCKS